MTKQDGIVDCRSQVGEQQPEVPLLSNRIQKVTNVIRNDQ